MASLQIKKLKKFRKIQNEKLENLEFQKIANIDLNSESDIIVESLL